MCLQHEDIDEGDWILLCGHVSRRCGVDTATLCKYKAAYATKILSYIVARGSKRLYIKVLVLIIVLQRV